MYKVTVKNRVLKNIKTMPVHIQEQMALLVDDIESGGPVQADWKNYGKLAENLYHCHLSYKWVACWCCDKNSMDIEVYYAGSRENAPY
jgi:hypothetical protein